MNETLPLFSDVAPDVYEEFRLLLAARAFSAAAHVAGHEPEFGGHEATDAAHQAAEHPSHVKAQQGQLPQPRDRLGESLVLIGELEHRRKELERRFPMLPNPRA